MSEIEKALREWVEKREARDRAREEYIENHRGHARALDAKVTAEGACLRAGDKALQSLPIGVLFPIIVGEYVVSKSEDRIIRVEKATVIGEAKPKAAEYDLVQVAYEMVERGETYASEWSGARKDGGYAMPPETLVWVWRPKT